MEYENIQLLDIRAPVHGVEVEWNEKRKVLYVHVDGISVLRICECDNIEFIGIKKREVT
jgi:hypothetical protein